MRIGFIGAGKVGCSLGKYFVNTGIDVAGYFCKNTTSLEFATEFTNTKKFETAQSLTDASDIIFLTVPDSQIAVVYESIKTNEKIFVHCSGALSSTVFYDNIYGYSLHPFMAINDKRCSYKQLGTANFTLEGNEEKIHLIKNLVKNNEVYIISAENKPLYHASAVFASNFSVALGAIATELLQKSGFTNTDIIFDIMENNIKNMKSSGIINSLTGPVARGDIDTIKKHMSVLHSDELEIYKLLSKKLAELAGKGDLF